MEISSKEEMIAYLKNNKRFFYEKFGVIRLGIFGSFAQDDQTPSSDVDLVVEIEESRNNIHSFLQLKRFLEKELAREIDLGFEHALKAMVREKIQGKIIYV